MRRYTSLILTLPLIMSTASDGLEFSFPFLFADNYLLHDTDDLLQHLKCGGLPWYSSGVGAYDGGNNCLTEDVYFGPFSVRLLCCILNPDPMDNNGEYYADQSQYTELTKTIANEFLRR